MRLYQFVLRFLLVALFGFYPALTGAENSAKTITFTCTLDPSLPETLRIREFYTEAFATLGYDFEMIHRPVKRARAEALSGISDGVCAMVPDLIQREATENLLEVDVVIGSSTVEVWSLEQRLFTLADLANPDYLIGHTDGAVFATHLAKSISKNDASHQPQLYGVTNTAIGLKMLASNRLTHFIEVKVVLDAAYRQTALRQPVYNSGTLATIVAKPYLHKNHAALLPAFREALQAVVDEHGIIEAF